MNDAEAQIELTRMFFAFAGGIAFFIAIYVFRSLRIYLFGRRVSAVVFRIAKEASEGRKSTYAYVVKYQDASSGVTKTARDHQGLPIQEFRVGDRVTAFVTRRGDVAEILSWRRLVFSFFVIAFVAIAMFVSYQFLLGNKNA